MSTQLIKDILIIVILLMSVLSCSKNEEEKLCILDDFYSYERDVIFRDSFVDNLNDWHLYVSDTMFNSDSNYANEAIIDNGLILHARSDAGEFALAELEIKEENLSYIAVEVKFKEFLISYPSLGISMSSNNPCFEFSYSNILLKLGEVKEENDFYANLSNETGHFLIDLKKNQVVAFTEEDITYDPGMSGPVKIYLENRSLKPILSIDKNNASGNEISFSAHAGFVDQIGPIPGTAIIEYVELYVPKIPCN